MQFMIIRRADAQSTDMERINQSLADQGRLGLALDLPPGSRALHLTLWPGGERITDGPFAQPAELVAGFTIFQAASKQEALALLAGSLGHRPASDAGADADADADTCSDMLLELRETGCPGGCAQVPPAVEGDRQRYVILLRSDAGTESDRIPPQDKLDALNAFNAAQAAAGVLLAGDGLKSSARGARVRVKAGRASVMDGPFAEAKELIAGFWMIAAASIQEAAAWARTLPYPTGPEVEVEIREVAHAAARLPA